MKFQISSDTDNILFGIITWRVSSVLNRVTAPV